MSHEIRLPRLGWSMEEGTFVGWLKKEGENVVVGDALFELEGEKALQEIESIDTGRLHIPADAPKPGSVVPVGALLGYLLEPQESIPTAETSPEQPSAVSNHAASQSNGSTPPAPPSVRRLARTLGVDIKNIIGTGASGKITALDVSSQSRVVGSTTNEERKIASPRAKRIAQEIGVDWKTLQGTGQSGRIRESDVRSAKWEGTDSIEAQMTKTGVHTISPRRKIIADRLRFSREQTIPVTLTTTAEVSNLVALRNQFKSAKSPIIPAYTDIIACLVVQVLSRHPQVAVNWDHSQKTLISIESNACHIGIAVDTPDGLLVPIIRDVANKSLLAVAKESRSLIERTRAGRLTAAEMGGGVMTLTNLGAYAIDAFTPIINYPEVMILGLGTIRREPICLDDDRIVVRDRMTLSLTFDHAAMDGAPAAAFLRDVALSLESPSAYLLSE